MDREKIKICLWCEQEVVSGQTTVCFSCKKEKSREDPECRKVIEKSEKEKICEFCGEDQDIELHHIDLNRKNSELENLAYVCKSCHNKVHNMYKQLMKRIYKINSDEFNLTAREMSKAYKRGIKYIHPHTENA